MSRETQFQNFSKLLWDEIMEMTLNGYGKIDVGTDPKAYEQLIARRAYDLAYHAIDTSRSNDMEDWYTEKIIPYVPDMAELPKKQIDWPIGDYFEFGKPDTSMIYRFLEGEGEDET